MILFNRTFSPLIFLFLTTIAFAYVCENEWVNYEEYCYRKFHYDTDYSNALSQCRYNYAELLTIDSAGEQDFVTTYMMNQQNNIWLDAANSRYQNWYNGSVIPSSKLKQRQCAVVMMVKRYEAKWFKEDCLNKNEVVCKKFSGVHPTPRPTPRPTPQPTTMRPTPPPTTRQPTNPPTPLPNYCRPGWYQFRNKCYRVTDSISNYARGKGVCETWRSEMTSIHSEAENDFIATLYDPLVHGTGNIWFRIGAIRQSIQNPFYWLDGTRFDYSNWCSHCPTTIVGRKYVWYSMNKNDRYKEWVNDPDFDRYSVCSYEISPTPTTTQWPTLPPTTPPPSICRVGWKQFGRKCYRVTDYYRTHDENQRGCESMGANLASVHSEVENNFIISLYDKNKHKQDNLFIFFQLGAEVNTLPNFYWKDGTPFDYTHWKPGYPVNYQDYTSLQVCVDPTQPNRAYTYWENFQNRTQSEPAYGVCAYYLP